ncbi:DDE-type integrase/transposase/recombinase [Aquibacillus sp. 3ASR75-11]|uniref:DDE-type integrase/transposase/recombinase n=1 Tax=Terrihalobacillus insolitus TaxID=2950438 RepID=A0A9X3WSW5_9BACI|nr:DDE-type integrase/transposase/recombinase [Terrihalobacillus insolitus]MDC3424243.1 DDE-type integrase/transposase/recombinase [Terrihalobacillus insolitus]
MNEKEKREVALFRYSLISPLLHSYENRKDYLEKMGEKVHDIPHYGERKVAAKTIQEWFLKYRREGLDGLMPRGRSDRGNSRRLSPDQQDHILAVRKDVTTMSVRLFYDKLIKDGEIQPNEVSYSTINRLLKKHGLAGKGTAAQPERKRFSHEKVNTLWQGDMSHGPYVPLNGKQKKTFLFAYIDDCSRVVPHAEFFHSEKFDGLRTVTKEAMIRRGKPKIIYADNGKIYRSETLQLACAQLGVTLAHTQPYDPQSKGKIERMFLTVQTRFYPLLDAEPAHSLEDLNERFWRWLEEDYHRKVHASLDGKTPLEIYQSQLDQIQMISDPSSLDPIFLKREYRKVKHDGTITLNKQLYEVPARFIGQRIELRFDDQKVFIYEDNQEVSEIQPVSFNVNAHVKREPSPLSFSKMKKEKEEKDHV